jgi:hypothetical protein
VSHNDGLDLGRTKSEMGRENGEQFRAFYLDSAVTRPLASRSLLPRPKGVVRAWAVLIGHLRRYCGWLLLVPYEHHQSWEPTSIIKQQLQKTIALDGASIIASLYPK